MRKLYEVAPANCWITSCDNISFKLSTEKRKNILVLNATSRVLYIIQYIMLGAYGGATLDVLGAVSSIAAGNKENRFINKRMKTVVITINLFILVVGLLFYKNIYSIFPVIACFCTLTPCGSAMKKDKEGILFRLSLLARV